MKYLIIIFSVILMRISASAQENNEVLFRTEEITVKAGRFGIKADIIFPAEGKNFPAVVFCTGSGPTDRKASIKYSKAMRLFIKKGYAVLIDDKPGYGGSTGEFSDDSLFRDRALILCKEIETLKKHPAINPLKIGVYGSSQASYVMSLAVPDNKEVSFVIAWSCPAMNSIEQSAYLVKMQALCGGRTKEEAEELYKYYRLRAEAKTYAEFKDAANYLNQDSVIAELGWGYDLKEEEFEPLKPESESYINPLDGLGRITIPALFIFGGKDTQIDPVQGAAEFDKSLSKAGNRNYRVLTVNGVDHNMRLTKTGSLREQKENYGKEGVAVLSTDFLDALEKWLDEIK
ncbi:MAG: hypothetical protein LWX07_00650 [Bacteroidetes bacterium]|nr:hypothetical protein [Bacteroidota bacterium]